MWAAQLPLQCMIGAPKMSSKFEQNCAFIEKLDCKATTPALIILSFLDRFFTDIGSPIIGPGEDGLIGLTFDDGHKHFSIEVFPDGDTFELYLLLRPGESSFLQCYSKNLVIGHLWNFAEMYLNG